MPTPLLNTVSLPEFTDLVEKEFVLQQKNFPNRAAELFIKDPIPANTGEFKRYDEVDTQTYARIKREGQDAAQAQVGVGYSKTAQIKRIAMEISITWEMRRFNKYPQVTAQLTSLTQFCPARADLDLTHRLTFATSTSYVDMDGVTNDITVGDGLALLSSVHTLKFSSTTYSNLVTGSPLFSQSALEAAELLGVSNIYSNFGERRSMDFNTIVTSDDPNTIREVKKLLMSTADVDTSNSGIVNTYKGRYTHLVLPRLATTALDVYDTTKRRWWFLVAKDQGINGWQSYYGVAEEPNLKTPAAGNNGEDFHNDNWTYGVRMSYLICILAGRGFIGSTPTS